MESAEIMERSPSVCFPLAPVHILSPRPFFSWLGPSSLQPLLKFGDFLPVTVPVRIPWLRKYQQVQSTCVKDNLAGPSTSCIQVRCASQGVKSHMLSCNKEVAPDAAPLFVDLKVKQNNKQNKIGTIQTLPQGIGQPAPEVNKACITLYLHASWPTASLAGQQVSHMSAARCCDWQKSTTRERDAAEGTVLPKACLNSLVEERGKEIAQLVSQCCAQDSAKRPSFTQVGGQGEGKP
eukprot:1156475-Pelagomonas_calceolata.AAC.6